MAVRTQRKNVTKDRGSKHGGLSKHHKKNDMPMLPWRKEELGIKDEVKSDESKKK